MNTDLCKAGADGLIGQKHMTAWASVQNEAAHARFANYSDQVAATIQGTRNFVAKYLA
jgi:hypothetical protein